MRLPKLRAGHTELCVCACPGVTWGGATSIGGVRYWSPLPSAGVRAPRGAEPWSRTSSLQQPGQGSWEGA